MARKKSFNIKKEDRHEWQRGCSGKVRYNSYNLAYQAKDKIRYGNKLNVYCCEFCQLFHLGRSGEKNFSHT